MVSIFALNLQYGEGYFRLSTVGNKSLLTWGHEKYKKHFMHHPLCPISEMVVNKGEHAIFCAFVVKFIPKKIFSFLAPSTMHSVFDPSMKASQDAAIISTNGTTESLKKKANGHTELKKNINIHEDLEDTMLCVEYEPDKNR